MTYTVPVSAKGIVLEHGRVWLRSNERGEWELPGGKLEAGEQPTQTVVRELAEELGLSCAVDGLVHAHLYHIATSNDEAISVFVLIYACHALARIGQQERMGEAGPAEFRLFPLNALPSNMPEFYREAIRRTDTDAIRTPLSAQGT